MLTNPAKGAKMDLSAVAPELRDRVRRFPNIPLGNRLVRGLVRLLSRLIRTTPTSGVTIENQRMGALGVRLYRPAIRHGDAALLWVHGGGYLIGAPAQDDRLCGETCARLGIVVVSVDYRLAPGHPYPAPADDCLAAWDWLQASAAGLGVDPARIAIGGQSAGGGLAAGLALHLRDRGGVQPIAQWLFCPMLDDRTAARRDLDAVGHRVWNNRLNRIGWRAFLGAEPGSGGVSARAAPARAVSLAGLPPSWIGIGTIDLFYGEDRAYAGRLAAAGVATMFESVPGAPHGFEALAPDTNIARAYIGRARGWLEQALRR